MKYIIIGCDSNGGFTCKCSNLKEATDIALNYQKEGATVISITAIEKNRI